MLINYLSLLIQAGDSKSSKEFRAEARYSEVFRRPLNSELDGKYSSRIVRSLGSTSGDIVGSKQRMDRINKIDKILGDGRLDMNDDQLTEKIIVCAFKVHNALGAGFSEKVYENVMRIELVRQSVDVRQQVPIKVYYEGEVVGEFYADLWVSRIIVELKAVQNLLKEHEVQLVNYLTATKTETGLLINFGASVEVRRKFREYSPRAATKL